MKRLKELFVIILLLMHLGISSAATQDMAKNITVQITDPAKDYGVQVRKSYRVKGTAFIPSGTHLWVLARCADFRPDFWWPQGEGTINLENKKWDVSVTFGEKEDIGKEFDIVAIVVSEETNAVLHAVYHRNVTVYPHGAPIPMPESDAPSVLRIVRKIGHGGGFFDP